MSEPPIQATSEPAPALPPMMEAAPLPPVWLMRTAPRLGVMGVGAMGRNHVRVLASLPGAELYAGRELYTTSFDWAGLDYMFPASFTGATYRIKTYGRDMGRNTVLEDLIVEAGKTAEREITLK